MTVMNDSNQNAVIISIDREHRRLRINSGSGDVIEVDSEDAKNLASAILHTVERLETGQ